MLIHLRYSSKMIVEMLYEQAARSFSLQYMLVDHPSEATKRGCCMTVAASQDPALLHAIRWKQTHPHWHSRKYLPGWSWVPEKSASM